MFSDNENTETKSNLISLLQLQMAEIEMLASMYPSQEEFTLDNPSVVADIDDFIRSKTTEIPPRLDFTLSLKACSDKGNFEVNVILPSTYPETEPEVYVRSSELKRDEQHHLNMDIAKFISSVDRGELCIGLLIQWLQSNSLKYFHQHSGNTSFDLASNSSNEYSDNINFSRLWIYSHHIFNKCKRRSILELGDSLHLTGFCLPGKPGIICVEGLTQDCNEFWQKLKHMSWKKIVLKKTETEEALGNDIDKLRKFKQFQEISFQPRQGPGREYHMDMGEFYRFLEEHKCAYAFQEYFGIEGRLSSST